MSDDKHQAQGKPDAEEQAVSGSPDSPPQPDDGNNGDPDARRRNQDKDPKGPGADGFEPEPTPGTTLPGYG